MVVLSQPGAESKYSGVLVLYLQEQSVLESDRAGCPARFTTRLVSTADQHMYECTVHYSTTGTYRTVLQ